MADKNAAIDALERNVEELKNGFNSIGEQQNQLTQLKDRVKEAERKLARDKRALLQHEEALAILKAGEE